MPVTYRFHDTWVVPGTPPRVRSVLVDLEHYPAWWPQVVAVARLGEDDARVLCRSVLPYVLDLRLHAAHRGPDLLRVDITGDLVGVASWRLTEEGRCTRLDFAQRVAVSGALGWASHLARPLLEWNHARMMAGCIAGLRRRLAVPGGAGAAGPSDQRA